MSSQITNNGSVAMPRGYATCIADLKICYQTTQIKTAAEAISPQVVAKTSRRNRQQLVDDNGKLGLQMEFTGYKLKKILPTEARSSRKVVDTSLPKEVERWV